MPKTYKSESEILELVASFESGTIPRGEWNHAGHLTVGLYYLLHDDLEAAIDRMRRNLLAHLRAVGVDFTKEMPFHETLTIFWMRTIAAFMRSKSEASLVDLSNELVARFDKNYPLRFYSREWLFSDEARARFVEGDLERQHELPEVTFA